MLTIQGPDELVFKIFISVRSSHTIFPHSSFLVHSRVTHFENLEASGISYHHGFHRNRFKDLNTFEKFFLEEPLTMIVD